MKPVPDEDAPFVLPDGVMRLLHDVDGLLGLAKHRAEHRLADPHHKRWENDAWNVLERVQRYTRGR